MDPADSDLRKRDAPSAAGLHRLVLKQMFGGCCVTCVTVGFGCPEEQHLGEFGRNAQNCQVDTKMIQPPTTPVGLFWDSISTAACVHSVWLWCSLRDYIENVVCIYV